MPFYINQMHMFKYAEWWMRFYSFSLQQMEDFR